MVRKEPSEDAEEHGRNAVIWAVLLLAGLGWGAWTLTQTERTAATATWVAWADGSAGVALNKSLGLPWQAQLQTGNAAVRYRVLGDVGQQVALGCPQWMFYQDGLRPQLGVGSDVFEARKQLARYWVEQLRQQGVQVLVAAVPDKARIEEVHLCGRPVTELMRHRLDEWFGVLQADGISYVDFRPVLQEQSQPVFFRTDVHMNALGAQVAAGAMAKASLPLLGASIGGQAFQESAAGTPQPLEGDLLALSGLKDASKGWRPEHDMVQPVVIETVRGGGLLDDAAPVEVLLAGSSNGLRSNFAPRLGMGLGREVWNLSMDGGQFSGALMAALKQRAMWPKTLKLVIWEFSENTLSLPLTDDEKAAFKALKSASSPV